MDELPYPRATTTGLAAPTSDDFKVLLRAIDPVRAEDVWRDICRKAGVSSGSYLLTIGEIDRLAETLKADPSVFNVVGQSVAIRAASYQLSVVNDTTGYHEQDWGRKYLEKLLLSRFPDPVRMHRRSPT